MNTRVVQMTPQLTKQAMPIFTELFSAPQWGPWNPEYDLRVLREPDDHVFRLAGLTPEGKLAGFIIGAIGPPEYMTQRFNIPPGMMGNGRRIGYLAEVGTAAAHQGNGVSHTLHKHLLDRMRLGGVDYFVVCTVEDAGTYKSYSKRLKELGRVFNGHIVLIYFGCEGVPAEL